MIAQTLSFAAPNSYGTYWREHSLTLTHEILVHLCSPVSFFRNQVFSGRKEVMGGYSPI